MIQYAVALGIISVWLFLVIVDSNSDTYSVPKELSAVAFFATGFVLGFDKLVALVSAWRRNGTSPEQEK
jgi:hypothetical protein